MAQWMWRSYGAAVRTAGVACCLRQLAHDVIALYLSLWIGFAALSICFRMWI